MQRWTLDSGKTDFAADPMIDEVARALLDGKLVGVPTETVYGLAADATNAAACARIYEAKGRPQFNPLISHVDSLETAQTHGVFNVVALQLAEAFWPGPLTLVVPKLASSAISDLVTAGLDTVALRVPAGPVMRALSAQSERPLAAPSANLSGKISATTADDVIKDLGPSIAHVIDAGPCPVGIESTIVACVGDEVRLLRPGGVALEELEAMIGRPIAVIHTPNDTNPQAPGMLTSHYAPGAKVRLNATDVRAGEALLAFGPTPLPGQDQAAGIFNLSSNGDLREAAARLFTGLRTLDATGTGMICVQAIPETGLGAAINDRLRRAAAPR